MKLSEKYSIDPNETKKITLSNESYAICEYLEKLLETIERARGSLTR